MWHVVSKLIFKETKIFVVWPKILMKMGLRCLCFAYEITIEHNEVFVCLSRNGNVQMRKKRTVFVFASKHHINSSVQNARKTPPEKCRNEIEGCFDPEKCLPENCRHKESQHNYTFQAVRAIARSKTCRKPVFDFLHVPYKFQSKAFFLCPLCCGEHVQHGTCSPGFAQTRNSC